LEGLAARTMRGEAVGLDGHVKARPREVESLAEAVDLDRMLTHRLRKTAPHQQPPHLHLQPRLEGGRFATSIEDAAQHRAADTTPSAELIEALPQEAFAVAGEPANLYTRGRRTSHWPVANRRSTWLSEKPSASA
jgi:hypothetical protein